MYQSLWTNLWNGFWSESRKLNDRKTFMMNLSDWSAKFFNNDYVWLSIWCHWNRKRANTCMPDADTCVIVCGKIHCRHTVQLHCATVHEKPIYLFFLFSVTRMKCCQNWALKYSDDNIRNWIFDTWVCECRRWSYTYVRTLYSIKFGRYSSTNYLDSSIFFIIKLRIPCVVYHIQLKCIVICIVVNVSLLWCNLVVLLHHLFNWQFNIFPKMMDIYLYGDLARIWMIEFRGVSSFNLFQFSILMKTVYCLVGEPHSAISMNCLAKRFSSCQRPHKPLHSIHSQH